MQRASRYMDPGLGTPRSPWPRGKSAWFQWSAHGTLPHGIQPVSRALSGLGERGLPQLPLSRSAEALGTKAVPGCGAVQYGNGPSLAAVQTYAEEKWFISNNNSWHFYLQSTFQILAHRSSTLPGGCGKRLGPQFTAGTEAQREVPRREASYIFKPPVTHLIRDWTAGTLTTAGPSGQDSS